MADDKSKTDKQDRDRVAGGQDYEARYLRRTQASRSKKRAN